MMNLLTKFATFQEIDEKNDTKKWLDERQKGIGGSDVGGILGLNKYSSPLTVYLSKIGEQKQFENNATKWGHILEKPIQEECEKEFGVKIEKPKGSFTNKENPFMKANIDGVFQTDNFIKILTPNGPVDVIGTIIHEIKTTVSAEGFDLDEIPDSYYCQVQHYMEVLGLEYAVLSVFILSSRELRHYVIEKNKEFVKKMVQAEKDFWNNFIIPKIAPQPNGNDKEKAIIETMPMDSVVYLPEECLNLIQEEIKINKQIKELEAKQSELKNKLLFEMAQNSTGFENADKTICEIGGYKISYTKQIKSYADTTELKKAGLFEKYSKESVSKILRISGGEK